MIFFVGLYLSFKKNRLTNTNKALETPNIQKLHSVKQVEIYF